MEPLDTWELRWIARHLPTLHEAGLRASSFDSPSRTIEEHDVYILTGSDHINLKVRHRENSLKLKTLVERTDDGLERWRTNFDVPLPAGPDRFRDVLDFTDWTGSAERLGAATRADEVIEILGAIGDPSQLIAVHKTRHLIQRGACGLDEVRFTTPRGSFGSLGVESSSLDELRSLVQDLRPGSLTSPCNYTQFLAAPH